MLGVLALRTYSARKRVAMAIVVWKFTTVVLPRLPVPGIRRRSVLRMRTQENLFPVNSSSNTLPLFRYLQQPLTQLGAALVQHVLRRHLAPPIVAK